MIAVSTVVALAVRAVPGRIVLGSSGLSTPWSGLPALVSLHAFERIITASAITALGTAGVPE